MSRLRGFTAATAAAALLGCSGEPGDAGGAWEDALSSRLAVRSTAGNKLLKVMTRNLYLGADLTPVLASLASGSNPVPATSATWAKVQIANFPTRATALADEIAATQPDLIGLQEAFLWRVGPPDSLLPKGGMAATTVAYDFLGTLLSELANRGLPYVVAAEVQHVDIELPAVDTLRGAPALDFLVDVRATDRDVILARSNLQTANPCSDHFKALARILGTHRSILRGWASVEVKFQGEWLRLINAHAETARLGNGVFNALQISELVDILIDEPLPVVLLGDLNAPGALAEDPGSLSYLDLVSRGGFKDSWHVLHPDEPGFTCCQGETLTNSSPQTRERIDHILFRGPISVRAAALVGEDATDMVEGLWPSDHAGVLSVLRLENQRFVARN